MIRSDTTRRKLTYRPENHGNNLCSMQEYLADWATGKRYIEPATGLRVYEGGAIHLARDGYRDPGLRDALLRRYGITILAEDELPTLYAPGAARKVAKSHIKNATLYIVDKGKVKALGSPHGRRSDVAFAWWTTFDTEVETGTVIKTLSPNKERRAAWLKEHEDVFNIARGVAALESVTLRGGSRELADRALRGSRDSVALCHLAGLMNGPDWERWVLVCTGDHTEYDYLTVEPNQCLIPR